MATKKTTKKENVKIDAESVNTFENTKKDDDTNTNLNTSSSMSSQPDPNYLFRTIKTGMVTNCPRLNMRRSPSITAEIIGVLNPGAVVKILRHTNEWYNIEFSGIGRGFCMDKYIEVLGSTSNAEGINTTAGSHAKGTNVTV